MAHRQKNIRCRSGKNCRCSTRKMGETQGTEGRVNHCPQTHDVSVGPQENRSCAEGRWAKWRKAQNTA